MKINTSQILIVSILVCLGFSPRLRAVNPAPDGGYPGGNTAEGQSPLLSLTTGGFNTAIGFLSLRSLTTGNFNTAVGAGTLLANTANENTAIGAGALLSDTSGCCNTANGAFALFSNTEGGSNTAIGHGALQLNTVGDNNAAIGNAALGNNTTGVRNLAIGTFALVNNTSGGHNVALGFNAGANASTGSNNVYIGSGTAGVAGESNACYIRSIFGQTSANGMPVLINSDNKLGTTTSSKRFKEKIKPMNETSEALFSLRPVTFRYKKEIDPAGTPQLGLVAEDVEKVNPGLVVRDQEGKPYSVRYDQVNAMLLNEFLKQHDAFLKEHRTVQELEATVAQQRSDFQSKLAEQQQQIKALTSTLEKVSARIELSRPATELADGH